MTKLLIIILIALTFFGCKDKISGFDSGNNLNKYPANLNYQWEYSSVMSTEYLNSYGGVDSTQTLNLPNTIVKISSINDSVPGYKNLINFEYYNIDTPEEISEDWYSNSDSAFSAIAYRNPGASYPVIPKNPVKKYLTVEEFKRIAKNLTFNNFINDDSIQYYDFPRVVLKYPLHVGLKWNELKTPFYRDRIVKGTTTLTINGKYYDCYIIEADVQQFKLKMVDYVSLQAGLLKREIISDSLALVSSDSPDSAIGYVSGHDVSILVNKNF